MSNKKIALSEVQIEGYQVQQILSGDMASARYPLHLVGANGFPVACYREFIGCFGAEFSVTAVDHRGAWPGHPDPHKGFTTTDFANDTITEIERLHTRSIIGVGHSHGGVVLAKAAQLRPDLFTAVIIVDGASLPNRFIYPIIKALPVAWVLASMPFIRASHERKNFWASKQAFRDRYASHRTFKYFTKQAIDDYVQFGLRPSHNGGFELAFNPHWESHIFRSVGYLWSLLKQTKTPTLLLHAQNSYMYTPAQFAQRNKQLPKSVTPATISNVRHLVPFEAPLSVVELIESWLKHKQFESTEQN